MIREFFSFLRRSSNFFLTTVYNVGGVPVRNEWLVGNDYIGTAKIFRCLLARDAVVVRLVLVG